MTVLLPLKGRTIIEHVTANASPVCCHAVALAGRIANDLGATVIRTTSGTEPTPTADAATSVFLHAGKDTAISTSDSRLMGADAVLTTAIDAATRSPVATPVTVIVSHGVPDRYGARDCDITDSVIQALSGLLDLIGDPAKAPVPLGGQQAGGVAGLAAFSGMVAALAAGRPETVRISALEACLWSNWKSYAERLYMGRTPTRQGDLAEWQALECADGFATLVYLEKDWPAVCRMIGDLRMTVAPLNTQAGRRANMAAVYEIVRPWYRTRARAEIAKLARAEGLPISPVLSVGEVLKDPQYQAQQFFAPALTGGSSEAHVPTVPLVWNGERFSPRQSTAATSGGSQASPQIASKSLAGCRVLDLGIITAGASTSATLADLGADVIKVEAPSYIDPFRTWDRGLGAPDWWNRSRFFDFTNRNKRAVAIDLKSARGRELFLKLVDTSDVLVENFRRGVLERLGLGWEVLSKRNPGLILCSITSQGERGPDAGAASYGSTLEANSGLTDLTRDAGGKPLISGILLNYPDQIVSIYAAGIVTLSVMQQRVTGRGARLDISQRELASFLIGEHILAASAGLPAPAVPKPDLHLTSEGKWHIKTPTGAIIPVCNGDDLFRAVETGEIREAFAKTPDGSDAKGIPFSLDGQPFAITRRAPFLGQHNAEVLREALGLDDSEIGTLSAQGILGTEPKA